jgi:hypothetical protein
MSPSFAVSSAYHSDRGGFTVPGALTSLAILAAAVAFGAPWVVRRLRAHAPAMDEAARRLESAVTGGLDGAGALAEATAGKAASLVRADGSADPSEPPPSDGFINATIYPTHAWDGPVGPPLYPPLWKSPPAFWRPFFTRPAPWHFHRRPPWRAGIRRRN